MIFEYFVFSIGCYGSLSSGVHLYAGFNPFGTVDGYSLSLRDATGPVDVYSRILTSTQVTCIAA